MNERPNIVWINTHDVSAAHLACYGDEYATTPHLDRFAAEGIRYTNAFASGPICSPARTSIFTGMHQTTVGTHHHRSLTRRPDYIRLLPEFLIEAGYACTPINTDLNTPIDADEWARYVSTDEALASNQPFFAVFSFRESHASTFKMSPEEVSRDRANLLNPDDRHDPENAPLPSFVPDSPLARERTALWYDALTQVDCHVGEVMTQLESHGQLDDTIVFFWSDHGTGHPRGKTHAYDDGLRVPLIIRFPKQYEQFAPGPPGTTVETCTMTMDMGASVLSMIGQQVPAHFQGRPFLGPLKGEPRPFACSARDRLDNCNEMIRTIRDSRYRYIRNFLPHRPYASFYPDGGFFRTPPAGASQDHDLWDTSCLPGKEKLHDPDGIYLMPIPSEYSEYLIWQPSKPFEELYDVETDPEELNNLADDEAYGDLRDSMRESLFSWMIETRDLGLFDETELNARAEEFGGVSYEVGARYTNFPRLLETADLSRLGKESRGELLRRLDDQDSAVRYWAITGLMSCEPTDDIVEKVEDHLDDESISVSLASADLLCRLGRVETTIPALERALRSDILWARCRAGANLSYLRPEILATMTSLVPALNSALDNPRCYGQRDPALESLIPPVRQIFNAQRHTIAAEWVIARVIRRIELSANRQPAQN